MKQCTFKVFSKTASTWALRLHDEDGRPVAERKLSLQAVQELVDRVEREYRTAMPNLETLGACLYEWLDGPTERWLEKALQDVPGLALHVDVEERLRHLPWELLCSRGAFLCAHPHRPFTPVRRVNDARHPAEPANRPLRVLFMACSPDNVSPVLDFEAEEGLILATTSTHRIELVVEESGSLTGLRERMEEAGSGHFDVFHLTGHATAASDSSGKPCFLMEDELGSRHEATADMLARAFSGRWPRLVFLSGCETGQATAQGTLPSLAEALVKAGAPAVLGWALPVGDRSASAAAATLYRELAVGKRVDEAVACARQELLEGNSKYWHLLRLYTNATPLAAHVTPPATPGRERLHLREAATEFLDAGKVEVCKRSNFVGRRRALQRCLRVLKSNPSQEGHKANLLVRMARGKWVEARLRTRFKHLKWSSRGVDAVDPTTGRQYEVLTGSDWNYEEHGRRMADIFFRMIYF